jgi:hypothetical protein
MKSVMKLALLPALILGACDQIGPTESSGEFNAAILPSPPVGTSAIPSLEQIDVCKRGPTGNYTFTLTQTGPDPNNPLSDDGADGNATIAAGTCERVAFNGGDRDTVIVTETVPAFQQLDSIVVQQLVGGVVTTTKVTGTATARATIAGMTAGEGAVLTFYNSLIPLEGRMTGGGTANTPGGFPVKVAFTVHCDITLSNNIEINWPDNKWHIDKPISSALCTKPGVPNPPNAGINRFEGTAVGALNGVDGYSLFFVFIDNGEPGDADQVQLRITAPGGGVVLNVALQLIDKGGNFQAHFDQPHKK